ncbi:DUF2129 domain-containing protein [Liberiplasma polymorphum]|jgi:uncharacterized protein YlbG (UPF0298 family)|uniref:DUF2129 domain-containing protein n=1 Tax=Liberiplasma polymorphum TaxID=3374570 RepID=UPI0037739130
MLDRKSLIVYFRNPKIIKRLEHVGHVTYFHKKRRYAVVYVNADEVDKVKLELEKVRHVRKVEHSLLFENSNLNPNVEEIVEEVTEEVTEETTDVK